MGSRRVIGGDELDLVFIFNIIKEQLLASFLRNCKVHLEDYQCKIPS